MFGFMGFDEFRLWYDELGKLMIFWAKKLSDISMIHEDDILLFEVSWLVRRRIKKAVLAFTDVRDKVNEAIELLKEYKDYTRIFIIPEDILVDLDFVDRRGVLYFWDTSASTLEPNVELRVVVLSKWSDYEVDIFRRIHKRSWGFFVPPRPDDHLVVLGFLGDEPVAMAYLNVHNFNIDYGVHVIRDYWRRRIGTRILREVLKLADEMGAERVSVVRSLRSKKVSASDRRAVNFYLANNPIKRFSIYRLSL